MANPSATASTNMDAPLSNLNPLKEFNISGSVAKKTDEKFGRKIVGQCEAIINSSYFTERNTRFALNRAMAAGRMNMTKFMDFFDMNRKTNYVNISWKSIMIVNTIINRLVGRWMTKREKAFVSAVDPVSIKKKKEKIDEAEFLLYNKDQLLEIQEQSGVKMIADDAYIPDDKDDLDLWIKEELRLPEEILYEKGINRVMEDTGWGNMGVNTRQVKIDSAEVGFPSAEVYADRNGKIHVDYCKPENRFYSYTDSADVSEAQIQGVIVSKNISEIRQMYPALPKEKIIEISKSAKQWSENDKIAYQDSSTWNMASFLPIDDWTVDIVRATFKTWDTDRSLFKKGRDGRMYVDKPRNKIEDVYEGNEYVENNIWNIYRLVYVKGGKKQILEWGLEKNMIRPQSYEKLGTAYSPFCGWMYHAINMRNLAIPEKIEEPVEQMILARLKIQQLVAKMRPAGYMYDIDGLQEMDLGNGIAKPLELQRVTNQTGDIFYRSKDAEGNRLDKPITEAPNSAGISKLQELIEVYNFHQQVLRDEIGSNEYAEGQTIKPRTGVQNVQSSLETSFNATDYMNDACRSLNEQIALRIGCLLKDSVQYGSKEYRELLKEEDVKDREFDTKVEMLPDVDQLNEFDATINLAIQSNPTLTLYMNPEKIKRIARDNIKLGESYYRQAMKRALKGEEEKAKRQSEMNAQIQAQAGVSVEQEKQKSLQMELQVKGQLAEIESATKQRASISEMFTGIYSKGLPVPEALKPLEQQFITAMAMPLYASNKQGAQQLAGEAAQEEEGGQEMAMQEEQMPEQPVIG